MKKLIYMCLVMIVVSLTMFGCDKVSDDVYDVQFIEEIEEQTNSETIEDKATVEEVIESEVSKDIDSIDENIDSNNQDNQDEMTEDIQEEVVDPIDDTLVYQQLNVNETGQILVVMYHGIKNNPPYHRTAENFLKDLEAMYDLGYRLISLEDYFAHHITVEAGFTPILLTFDDGLPSTFALEEVDGILKPKVDTAVGILEAFIQEHPDFGRGGAFFINNNGNNTFYGAGTLEERLNWLVENGYDVGNHTSGHKDLSTLSSEILQSEIGKVENVISTAIEGYEVLGLSYPFGIRPTESNRPLALDGQYNEITYTYKGAFAVGPTDWYYPAIHTAFNPLLIPRTRGSEGSWGDLWYYLEYFETYPDKRYISDGNAETIVVPEGNEEVIESSYHLEFDVIVYTTEVVEDAQ